MNAPLHPIKDLPQRPELFSKKINEIYISRFERFCQSTGFTKDQAVRYLVKLHQFKVNVGEVISRTIDDNHEAYKQELTRLGVDQSCIR